MNNPLSIPTPKLQFSDLDWSQIPPLEAPGLFGDAATKLGLEEAESPRKELKVQFWAEEKA